MNFKLLTFIFVISLSTACQHHEHHHADGLLSLNEGQRWQANQETTAGIQAMQTLLADFDASDTTQMHRQILEQSLTEAYQGIFDQCTMKGEAHEQLHHFLLPMNELIKATGSTASADSEKAMQELTRHLDQYKTYFQ